MYEKFEQNELSNFGLLYQSFMNFAYKNEALKGKRFLVYCYFNLQEQQLDLCYRIKARSQDLEKGGLF